jgi:hypothetical protein
MRHLVAVASQGAESPNSFAHAEQRRGTRTRGGGATPEKMAHFLRETNNRWKHAGSLQMMLMRINSPIAAERLPQHFAV